MMRACITSLVHEIQMQTCAIRLHDDIRAEVHALSGFGEKDAVNRGSVIQGRIFVHKNSG